MIYLKNFSSESNYVAYRDGSSYLKPNVSFSIENKVVYYNYPSHIAYDYVDLNLPSGTKWASSNVGASKPSDFGLYFQWGDAQGYTKEQIGKVHQFKWDDYKWNPSGDGKSFTKYNNHLDNIGWCKWCIFHFQK